MRYAGAFPIEALRSGGRPGKSSYINRSNRTSLRAFLTRRVSLTDGIVQLYTKRILSPAGAFKVIALSGRGYVDCSGYFVLLSGSNNLLGSGRLDGCLFCRSGVLCGGCPVGRGGFCCGDGGSGAGEGCRRGSAWQ